MLEHVAAWLGASCPPTIPLRRLVSNTPDFANLVVHWIGDETRFVQADQLAELLRQADDSTRSDVLTPAHVRNDARSTVARFTIRRRLSITGFELDDKIDSLISQWQQNMRSIDRPREHI
jgi:hypothetical protein